MASSTTAFSGRTSKRYAFQFFRQSSKRATEQLAEISGFREERHPTPRPGHAPCGGTPVRHGPQLADGGRPLKIGGIAAAHDADVGILHGTLNPLLVLP